MGEEQAVGAPSSGGALRKVAICGTADSLKAAPYGDPAFEIWGCSPCMTYPVFKRQDRIFEMHPRDYWGQTNEDGEYVIARLNRADCPVMMQDHYDEVPKSEPLPVDKMTGEYRKNYSSSIAYMLAYAIYREFHHIALFGVQMAADEEYAEQRAACEYWIGIAEGQGIDVWIHPQSSVCACKYQYGYEPPNPILNELRALKDQLQAGADDQQAKEQSYRDQRLKNVGAVLLADRLLKKHGMWGVQT